MVIEFYLIRCSDSVENSLNGPVLVSLRKDPPSSDGHRPAGDLKMFRLQLGLFGTEMFSPFLDEQFLHLIRCDPAPFVIPQQVSSSGKISSQYLEKRRQDCHQQDEQRVEPSLHLLMLESMICDLTHLFLFEMLESMICS